MQKYILIGFILASFIGCANYPQPYASLGDSRAKVIETCGEPDFRTMSSKHEKLVYFWFDFLTRDPDLGKTEYWLHDGQVGMIREIIPEPSIDFKVYNHSDITYNRGYIH